MLCQDIMTCQDIPTHQNIYNYLKKEDKYNILKLKPYKIKLGVWYLWIS